MWRSSGYGSGGEDGVYKRPSALMQEFHSMFEADFNNLYDLAEDGKFAKQMSLQSFLRMAKQFINHLTMHHGIEERQIFPLLGQRMPAFRPEAEHIESHVQIHEGLDRLSALIDDCKATPSSFSPTAFRGCLDSFREVLFHHLNQEVADLSAEEFKKHYTVEEMRELPF